jgi:hypothetical protein
MQSQVGMGDSRADEIRYDLARNRARGLITLTRQRPPIDVMVIIDLGGIPIVERALPDGTRATIGDVAGRRSIILNRKWKFSSENERRWVLAEEVGHILLGHKLVESTEPGKPMIGLLQPRRVFYEREARAFAAELLMPFGEVRRRWFGLSSQGMSVEEMVRRLADEFGVTPAAMRVRLQQMKLIQT